MNSTDIDTSGREPKLAQAFVRLADTLVDDYDVAEVLYELVEYCVELLDATAAGIMLSDQQGNLYALAAIPERARLLELFQLQNNEGPCLESFHSGEAVLVPDLSTQTERWPRFAPEAMQEGYNSVNAIPMRLRHDTIGALNILSTETGLLGEEDSHIARGLADIATIGILHERAVRRGEVITEQLQTALNNRVIIEQSKGVLAHAGNLPMHDAFNALRAYSRSHSARLSDVAHALVAGDTDPAEVIAYHPASQREESS